MSWVILVPLNMMGLLKNSHAAMNLGWLDVHLYGKPQSRIDFTVPITSHIEVLS